MQWHFGPFRLDLDNACLWRGEQRVTLRPKALDILVYLVEHAGTLVIKEALLDAVWPDTVVAEGVLATSMVELRKALGETARKPQFIATVHRRGYRFIAPVVASDPREPAAMLPDALANSTLSPVYALQGSSLPRPGRVDQMLRRLAAILSADVQGYSRLMGDDEAATLQTLTTYRALMVARIAQHRGRVVGAPGDNLLAEFASVVDAVQCAVALQREFAERNGALPAHRQMWFRMGINLGEVLVEGDQIYGDGVNIAARLEGIAEGGGICVSGTAYDQIENKLDLTYIDLGEQTVKNIARPIRVYRVQLASAPTTSLAPHESPLAWHPTGSRLVRPARHLVGREAELAQLHACWTQALQGDRQVVFITGEAGIGKTTLVDTFVVQMAHTSVPWVGRGQCIEHYGVGEAYLPLLEAFGGLCRGPEGAHLLTRLTQQAPSWLLQMPALLSLAEYDTLQRRVASATRERMLRELAEAVETLSTERALVLVLEDLHWSDASTLEWLAYVARRRQPARLLVLGTYRPADAIVHEHPVRVVTQELLVHGQCHQVVVGYLSEAHVEAYLTLRLGTGSLSATLAPLLQQRSNGNPLFLVTMVEEMVRQGVLHEGTAGWEVAAGCDAVTLEAPESLRHLITQQFEQFPRDAQVLLEAASAVGKAFTVTAVAAVIDRPPEEVEEQCTELARRGQWVRTHGTETWPDGTMTARFAFLHDLYREMAYVQVPMSRRARWHQQIGL